MIANKAVLSVFLGMLASSGPTSTTMATSNEKADAGADQRTERSSRGLVTDIEKATEQNDDFRRVIYTAKHSQLVVMALPPGEHIGAETHADVDQFFRVEQGSGEVVLGSKRQELGPGSAIVIPAGTKHDVKSTGDKPLKLYTIYSPPQHRDGVVQHTRAQAEADKEHFDGKTTR